MHHDLFVYKVKKRVLIYEELQSDSAGFPVQFSATISTQTLPPFLTYHFMHSLHLFSASWDPGMICKLELLFCLPNWPAAMKVNVSL